MTGLNQLKTDRIRPWRAGSAQFLIQAAMLSTIKPLSSHCFLRGQARDGSVVVNPYVFVIRVIYYYVQIALGFVEYEFE